MTEPRPHSSLGRLWKGIKSELNFYRAHLIYFTITPLVFSAIFYASNGRYHIAFIDALFNCFSAMTVCGLATVNLSSLTGWQQTILFILMNLGNPVFVSWFMVLVRRHYFAREFDQMLASAAAKGVSDIVHEAEEEHLPWPRRIAALLQPGKLPVVAEASIERTKPEHNIKGGIIQRLRPDMIRRMDDALKPVNPSGWVTDGKPPSLRNVSTRIENDIPESDEYSDGSSPKPSRGILDHAAELATTGRPRRRLSDPGAPSRPPSPTTPIQRFETMMDERNKKIFPRHQTIEFAPTVQPSKGRTEHSRISETDSGSIRMDTINPQSDLRSIHHPSLARHHTINTHVTQNTAHTAQTQRTTRSAKTRGFGGFPTPGAIISFVINRFFPKLKRKLTRTVTIPITTSLVSTRARQHTPSDAKAVPYISFSAVVGRNSAFHLLTNEQLEEIGGVEYRALNALLWIVAGYHIGVQLIAFTVIAPYISTGRWASVFLPPNQVRPVPPAWFSLFQVISAYTNTGTSLVDQSMIPFENAYVLLFFTLFMILAGNCAYPLLLRLLIWTITKFTPRTSRLNETLHFLLDHPRRCYTHLFPSHQTWFLFTVVLFLTSVDWFFFMVLDIGNAVIDRIPLGTRFAAGLFQAAAVRAAGFGIVPLSALAPAVKVLYTIMMYINPIAMSVRSTNVYEEQSLGIFKNQDEELEERFDPAGPRMHVWSRYLAMHARKQLAFDMWWLCSALFLLCILERHNLNNPDFCSWFNIFAIIFELVSAYGTVGLSLGIPDQNFALSGAFRPLSKLIICVVMLRGRHRGLPVAIDRAILLPSEFQSVAHDDEARTWHDATASRTDHVRQPRPNSYSGDDHSESHLRRRQSTRKPSITISGLERMQPMSDSRKNSSIPSMQSVRVERAEVA